jgi:hypothetical protein
MYEQEPGYVQPHSDDLHAEHVDHRTPEEAVEEEEEEEEEDPYNVPINNEVCLPTTFASAAAASPSAPSSDVVALR